jgi:hypothetical protein
MILSLPFRFISGVSLLALLCFPCQAWAARDAAFLDPGAAISKNARGNEAIVVEPKSDVDVGETQPNVGRRATFFFVNQTGVPVSVESVSANGDSNVRADIVSDDCSKEKRIGPGNRCAITVETTPVGSGSWTAELLMTHDGVGRIARARVLGKTSGMGAEKRETGLSLNTKDMKPVDFGEVQVGSGKAVRTALMVNDSNEVISILSIELIAAENGLERLDQGCEPDTDLKMGESCPVTLLWRPTSKSDVSTDLIIRHSGRLGFAVIPVRGVAKDDLGKGGTVTSSSAETASSSGAPLKSKSGGIQPPSVADLEQILADGKIPPISGEDLPAMSSLSTEHSQKTALEGYQLIGTVGNRAVILKPDGQTSIVALGEEVDRFSDKAVKLVNVTAKAAEIVYEGKSRILKLGVASSLAQKATAASRQDPLDQGLRKRSSDPMPSAGETKAVPLPTGKK